MHRAALAVTPTPPFDFDLTADYATYHRGRVGTDSLTQGTYRRLLDLGNALALATVRSTGTVDAPRLEVELVSERPLGPHALAEAQRQVAWLLGADEDLEPFYRMAQGDRALASLVRGLRGLHVPRTATVFEALVQAILGQQISGHVARMLRTALVETYGPSLQTEDGVYYAFPRPQALMAAGVDGLRALRLSSRKAEYIADIAARVASGALDLEGLRHVSDEEAVAALTAIRGVGAWTAHWLLIRALGRADGFPHGDLALQRALGLLANGGVPMSAQEALEYSRRWSPYRSYATAYLFAAIRTARLGELAVAAEPGV